MKILRLVALFLLIGLGTAFAAPNRVETHQLTIGGSQLNNYVIPANNTVTSDSVYQIGTNGFLSLATWVVGNVSISYQISYDNINWWTPYTTNAGTLTSAGTIATSITGNRWIIATAIMAPYIRFNYSSTGTSTIDSLMLWQDQS